MNCILTFTCFLLALNSAFGLQTTFKATQSIGNVKKLQAAYDPSNNSEFWNRKVKIKLKLKKNEQVCLV